MESEELKAHYKEVDKYRQLINNKATSLRRYEGMEEYTAQLQLEFRRLLDRHYALNPDYKNEYEDMYQKYQKKQSNGYRKQVDYKECLETFVNWCDWVVQGKDF